MFLRALRMGFNADIAMLLAYVAYVGTVPYRMAGDARRYRERGDSPSVWLVCRPTKSNPASAG